MHCVNVQAGSRVGLAAPFRWNWEGGGVFGIGLPRSPQQPRADQKARKDLPGHRAVARSSVELKCRLGLWVELRHIELNPGHHTGEAGEGAVVKWCKMLFTFWLCPRSPRAAYGLFCALRETAIRTTSGHCRRELPFCDIVLKLKLSFIVPSSTLEKRLHAPLVGAIHKKSR